MAKILIVDDEPRIRDLIREHLQYAGFVCEEAGDGGAALAVLAQGGIDLVILDIMMPFMDGMTCLREMRTRKIMTPVIMLTARSEEYDKLAGITSCTPCSIIRSRWGSKPVLPRFPGGFHDLPPNHPTEKRRVLLSAQWHRGRRPGRTGQFHPDPCGNG